MPLSCPVTFVSVICDQIIRKTGNNASLGSFMPHSEKKGRHVSQRSGLDNKNTN